MSISTGTFTFGNLGADYLSLNAALTDVAASLTGDLTLNQIADSDDTGVDINKTISNVGHVFTLKSSTPHNGSPIQGFRSKFKSIFLKVNCFSGGTYNVDDWYGYSHSGAIQLLPGTISGAAKQNISNCLFRMEGAAAIAKFAYSTPTSAAGNTWVGKFANNKFWTNAGFTFTASTSGSASENPKYSLYMENNDFTGPNTASSGPAIVSWQLNTSIAFPLAAFVFQNNMVWNGDVSKPAMTLSDAVLAAGLAHNARNGGSDVLAWAVTGIAVPGDILTLSAASDDFLNAAPGGSTFEAGGVPVVSFNPYPSPYPIGTRFPYIPAPVVGGSVMMPHFVPGF